MSATDSHFNDLLEHIVKNSLFTERQLYIISKVKEKQKLLDGISSGAYYRQIRQCKNKIFGVVYSMMLLKIINILDEQAFNTINELSDRLAKIISQSDSDLIRDIDITTVISKMDQLISSLSNIN
ncbi:MAG: hypothetical protein WCA39_12725 [Nitrososphaeraceae archaeon]|jgi:hypothetical protein